MERECTEGDWKLFRKKLVGWQDAYIDKLNKEYLQLLGGEGSPAKKFWELEKRIRADRRKAGVIVEMKRSLLVSNLVELVREGVITLDDLSEFSEGLQEAVRWPFEVERGL